MPDYNQFSGAGDLGEGIGRLFAGIHKRREASRRVNEAGDALTQFELPDPNDPEGKKTIKLFNPKAVELWNAAKRQGDAQAQGHLEGMQRMLPYLMQAQTREPKYETEVVPGKTLPLNAGQSAQVLMHQQDAQSAPAGKQYWGGDEQAPPGYYTPNQIEGIHSRRMVQRSRDEFSKLRNGISVAKTKVGEKTNELEEFTKAYGFPAPLFDSKTKIYNEGTKLKGGDEKGGVTIPEGYYGFDVINKQGEQETRKIGIEEFNAGKKVYEDLKTQRGEIGKLGDTINTSTAKARAMLDWAERNPGAPGAAQVKAKAQADLAELGLITSGQQPGPSPTPAPDREEM